MTHPYLGDVHFSVKDPTNCDQPNSKPDQWLKTRYGVRIDQSQKEHAYNEPQKNFKLANKPSQRKCFKKLYSEAAFGRRSEDARHGKGSSRK